MENKTDILNELKELSPVIAALEKVNVFTVPEGYFEYLSADILTGIETESDLAINASSIIAVDEVPTGYFDTVPDAILTKIKALESNDAVAEIKELSPMLHSIQSENIFEVPAGYFENLSADVLQKIKPQSKVVNIQSRTRTFFKYAVAAAFTGVMALGVFKFTADSTNRIDLPDYVTAGLLVDDVDQGLSEISNAEIVKYLEASGTDVKAAFVANSIDKNELPAQEDYLLDDQALDKYLNSINLDDLKN